MSEIDLEDLKDASMAQIAGYFLGVVIIVASIAYGIFLMRSGASGTTLSVIFYGIVPVSLALIIYQTFNVARILYSEAVDTEQRKKLSKLIIGLVIGVAALNLGFMTVLTSGPKMLQGTAGLYKFIMLMVVLSFGLAISLLTDHHNRSEE